MLSIFSLITLSLSAQYAETPVLKGSTMFVDGKKIPNREAVNFLSVTYGDSVADDWIRYRKGYKTGVGLTIAGASLTFCGGVVLGMGLYQYRNRPKHSVFGDYRYHSWRATWYRHYRK